MLRLVLVTLLDPFRSRASLEAEIFALRHQVAVLKQRLGSRRVRLSWRDRMFWTCLSTAWSGWRTALVIVQPETVLRWHREGFRAYSRRKSRPRGGRPHIDRETRDVIARMHRENPLWGAPRIHGELLMLGIDVAESTVSHYLQKLPRLPSQNWRTFVRNQVHQSVAVDFAVVPTITFSLLYVFVVLDHERRRILHINMTANPTAQWAAQQVVEALPWETNVRFLFRDGDGIYGEEFKRRVTGLGLQQVVSPRAVRCRRCGLGSWWRSPRRVAFTIATSGWRRDVGSDGVFGMHSGSRDTSQHVRREPRSHRPVPPRYRATAPSRPNRRARGSSTT